jgi:D-alanyl-D-alanine carboxypeptidase/RTX calcium-binding nonapeptide repeat (4 copies)
MVAVALAVMWPLDASAAPDCKSVDGSVRVAVPDEESASVRVGDAQAILVDGERCGTATTANTDAIAVSGGRDSELAVDLRGGPFGDIPIHAKLGRVRVVGGASGEKLTVRGGTIQLGAKGGEVAMEDVSLIVIEGGRGGDTIRGGNGDDVIRGGPGRDRLRGAGGADQIFGGHERDRMWGGAGPDRLAGGTGTDVCEGGADRDRLLSCSPRFDFSAAKIGEALRERMNGRSFHGSRCPVGLSDLRYLRLRHWGFDGDVHRGELVVHRDAVGEMRTAFRRIFRARFPIRRMQLIDDFGGDDHRSMDADNTSAFNCRVVAGTDRWSEHAYGHAIDVNPVENPYVTSSGHVSPPAGRPYADRSRDAPGMIKPGDAVVSAFAAVGWPWHVQGWPKDYQHFSVSGH